MIQETANRPATAKVPARTLSPGNDRIDSILLRLDDQRINQGKSSLVFGVTGSDRGCGVSTVAGRLAVRAAQMQLGPVLIIDGNIEHPRQHKNFKVPMNAGTSSVFFSGENVEDAICPLSIEGLSVLPAGAIAEAGAANPEAASLAMRELRLDYPLIIVDLPPTRNTSRSFILSKLCDGVVLVLDARTTGMKQVKRVMHLLNDWDVDVLGSILNRAKRTLPSWLDRWL